MQPDGLNQYIWIIQNRIDLFWAYLIQGFKNFELRTKTKFRLACTDH